MNNGSSELVCKAVSGNNCVYMVKSIELHCEVVYGCKCGNMVNSSPIERKLV